ncbi:hypothetical protein ES702_07038 [subsurface metagenome]
MVSNSGAYSRVSSRTAKILIIHLLTFGNSSYDLPFHAFEAKIYPILSPDGASIAIFSHEEGLSLYKIRGQSTEGQSLLSQDAPNVTVDNKKDESSYNRPRLEKWLDVQLESPAQHIALPPVSAHAVSNTPHLPDTLVSNLIIAVSCEDLTVVLISVPFAAKSDESKNSESRLHIKTTYISRGGGHQNTISAIAITWTADGLPKSDKDSQSRSRGRETVSADTLLTFIVASASTTGSGLLIVSQIPFQAHFTSKSDDYTVILRQFVRLPLLDSVLSFNSSIHPSSSHLSLLLTSPADGIVKIYELAKNDILSSGRKRDSGTLTASDDTLPIVSTNAVLTLHTAYASLAQSRRKAVLDASWVSSGQAILALLEDGEWGLWYTNLSDSTLSSGSHSSRFTSLGQLNVASPIKRSSKAKTLSSLAPMTPHTRKTRSADLFGQPSRLPGGSLASAIRTGQITPCGSSRSTSSQYNEFILSYDGTQHYLPSLQALYQSVSEEGRVRTAGNGRLQVLPEMRLGGGQRLGTYTAHTLSTTKSSNFLGTLGQTPDLVVLTDTRIIVFSKAAEQPNGAPLIRNLAFRDIGEGKPTVSRRDNETLDVEGIDKMLDSMEGSEMLTGFGAGGNSRPLRSSQPPEAGVLVDDVLESPSDLAATRSVKLVIDQKDSGPRRNLFASSK